MVKLRIEPDHLQLVVIFKRDSRDIGAYVYPILKPEDYRTALTSAFDQFHQDHPDLDLLDNITIAFDKVD